jgi:GNAT superfamily N-acetyltransferase
VPEPHRADLGDYEISTDTTRLDVDRIRALLGGSYWAADRTREVIERSIANSLCFGVYRKADGLLVAFARVVTDYATFSWLTDVIVDADYRGAGLGKALIEAIVNTPEIRDIRMTLATRDAHGLYAQYGFAPLPRPEGWMIRPDAESHG